MTKTELNQLTHEKKVNGETICTTCNKPLFSFHKYSNTSDNATVLCKDMYGLFTIEHDEESIYNGITGLLNKVVERLPQANELTQ